MGGFLARVYFIRIVSKHFTSESSLPSCLAEGDDDMVFLDLDAGLRRHNVLLEVRADEAVVP